MKLPSIVYVHLFVGVYVYVVRKTEAKGKGLFSCYTASPPRAQVHPLWANTIVSNSHNQNEQFESIQNTRALNRKSYWTDKQWTNTRKTKQTKKKNVTPPHAPGRRKSTPVSQHAQSRADANAVGIHNKIINEQNWPNGNINPNQGKVASENVR